MLAELLLLLSAATNSSTPPDPPQSSPIESSEQADISDTLAEYLVAICARHPEVERAFLLMKTREDGQTEYMFIPIFDGEVSDEALDEADHAYKDLAPGRGSLPLMLLARNTWKKELGGYPPIYVRPDK